MIFLSKNRVQKIVCNNFQSIQNAQKNSFVNELICLNQNSIAEYKTTNEEMCIYVFQICFINSKFKITRKI